MAYARRACRNDRCGSLGEVSPHRAEPRFFRTTPIPDIGRVAVHPDRGTPRAAGWKGWSERHRGPMGWPGRPRLPPTPSRRSRGGRGRCIVGDHCSILEFLPVAGGGMALPPRSRSFGSLDKTFENANFACGHRRVSAVIRRGVPPNTPPLTCTRAASRPTSPSMADRAAVRLRCRQRLGAGTRKRLSGHPSVAVGHGSLAISDREPDHQQVR